mgnify:FL=1|tara:strand:+ start:54800 stop:55738 length:939 start_codon:yes stop_codon:yes gene_type:complete
MDSATQEKIASLKWFHSIDFGDFASSGRFRDDLPQNMTLFPTFELLKALDLHDATLLDCGTYDGIVAFGASQLGTKRVIGMDTFDQATFRLSRKLLGLEDRVEYIPNKQMRDLTTTFEPKSLDVIVCAGIIYHMLYPMQAFIQPRLVLKDGGYLIMETPFNANDERAILSFNGIDTIAKEPLTYFVPTRSALIGMAALAGFKVEAIRELSGPKRITLLLKAVSREELIDDERVAPYTKQMLKRDICDDEFRFTDLEALPILSSMVTQALPLEYDKVINPNTHSPVFPFHPPADRERLGTTRYETKDGNLLEL